MNQAVTRTAIVHDWFTVRGGAERCAIELANLLPDATIHTSFFNSARYGNEIDPARVRPWPIQRLTGPTDRFRSFLPLYPLWFGNLDFRDRELVVSSSSAFAKAVKTSRQCLHVSYIHTPMRYAWDLDRYLAGSSWSLPAQLGARALEPLLQHWDVATSKRPDILVANSNAVRERIRRRWGRESELIYPPVDVAGIPLSRRDDGFLFIAARMLAYRRLDVAVDACTQLGRELVVVGDGPENARLRRMAGPKVRFLGRVGRPALVDLFSRCHAYLVSGVEDFGIAPVEAMAAGKPVVAFRAGGALDTVVDGQTGVFFDGGAAADLAEAIKRMDELAFDPAAIRRHAEAFDTAVFRAKWRELLVRLAVDPSLYRLDEVPGVSESSKPDV